MKWVNMTQFETVLRKVQAYRPNDDLAVLRNAYLLCQEKHQGQKRLSGEPYITHPLEVTNILADLRLDTVCLAAGMLHDVVEDTSASIDALKQQFGPEVARIVRASPRSAAFTS